MTTTSAAPSEALVAHALELLATAEVGLQPQADAARDSLARWRSRSPEHERAHAEARQRWQMLEGASAGLRERWPDPWSAAAAASRRAPPRPARRNVIALALALVGVGGVAGLLSWRSQRQEQALYARSWHTGTAQLLRVALGDEGPDGGASEATLSARTALRVTLYRDRREAMLVEGEARFDVRRDPGRPFVVHTRAGRVEVVGTAFTVADRGGAVHVAVERGRVRLLPAAWPAEAPATELAAGQAATLRAGQAVAPVQAVSPGDVGAWREGWLVFDDTPLAEAVPAINAFRRHPLTLADAAVGRLRLTARFRSADDRQLLAALPAVLPLRAVPQPDGSVRLEVRP